MTAANPAAEATGRNGVLDAIRLSAALLVFAAHVGLASGHPGGSWVHEAGFWGVFLFFILSGYLIPTVYARGGPYFRRRLLRILPAYWFAVVGLALLTGYPLDLATLLMLQPIDQREFDTFLGVAWTLKLEMVFYLLVPALALVPTRWIVGAGAASLVLYELTASAQLRAEFPWRFWMFLPGMLLARRGLPAALSFGVPRVVTYGAAISYGIYLWHHEILRWIRDLGLGPVEIAVGGAVLTFTAAAISWHVVERPLLADKAVVQLAVDVHAGGGGGLDTGQSPADRVGIDDGPDRLTEVDRLPGRHALGVER